MAERDHWNEYQNAYEDMIRNTATKENPWYVEPADNKWFTRVVVVAAVVEVFASLDPAYPKVDKVRLEEIAKLKESCWIRNKALAPLGGAEMHVSVRKNMAVVGLTRTLLYSRHATTVEHCNTTRRTH